MHTPVQILLDTDMLTDCDDAGALAMLHVLADRGEAKILGVAVNGIDSHGLHGSVVSAINYHFGRPEIPVAMSPRGEEQTPVKPSSYSSSIYENYPHDGLRDAERPNAVELYHRLLSEAEDHSVTIVSIGFLSNIADLLAMDSGPALVARKVKGITIMGGAYPSGNEYNFDFSGTGPTTQAALEAWPETVPITFIGYELGERVITGTDYQAAPDSPMRRAYELAYDSINRGRPSWDQVAVFHAVRGLHSNGCTWFNAIAGKNRISATGQNSWQADPSGPDAYLELAVSADELASTIEQLMVTPPATLSL
ncbi:nucleoside hydrolase [Coraliomargarita sp. SDUM461003]|uniref:Nucleoside hydrolase n=1 Tax=Thalassobacterium maritimum TaxID=3041265 RepID=A0ABU1AX59_9BACT|nr:nucleoside hydrolase [Coraliomargarita sp. SDUM461003]MDQ8208744.1 nucleoside hydrolase [Coraliomargarita sp. SDUM461003]